MNLQELEQKYQELGQEIERLKKSEVQYPIYCRSKETDSIVKFNSLQEGVYVKNSIVLDVGEIGNNFIPHTDTDHWQQLEVCPETGFFDGQLVWCWDNIHTSSRALVFYNAKHKRAFNHKGERIGVKWDNYEPYEGNYPDWAQKAFETLEIDYEEYN